MDVDIGFGCRGGPAWPPACVAARAPTRGRPYIRIEKLAKDPMPSGGGTAEEGAHTAKMDAGLGHEGAGGGRIGAVAAARAGAAGATLGGARAGAQAAMQAAAAVGHGGLAAARSGAGAGAAAGRGEEIARTGTVPQPAAAVGRQAGGRGERGKGAKEPMPSGGAEVAEAVIWGLGEIFGVALVRVMF
jgi:hypothetical protein